jgi:hypothetical protein
VEEDPEQRTCGHREEDFEGKEVAEGERIRPFSSEQEEDQRDREAGSAGTQEDSLPLSEPARLEPFAIGREM